MIPRRRWIIFLFVLVLVLCLTSEGWSREGGFPTSQPYMITLSIGGGGSNFQTAPGGVSPFTILGNPKHISGTTILKGLETTNGIAILQISFVSGYQVDSGNSIMSTGDDYFSSNNITIRYWESLLNTEDAIAGATRYNIISLPLGSGSTIVQVPFTPEAMGYMGFELVSGISPYSGITAYAKIK